MDNNDNYKIECMECVFSVVDIVMCLVMGVAIFGILRMVHGMTEQHSEDQNVESVTLLDLLR